MTRPREGRHTTTEERFADPDLKRFTVPKALPPDGPLIPTVADHALIGHNDFMTHERWEVIEVRLKDGQWRRVGPHRAGAPWSEAPEFPDSGRAWKPFSSNETSLFYRKYVAFLPHGELT